MNKVAIGERFGDFGPFKDSGGGVGDEVRRGACAPEDVDMISAKNLEKRLRWRGVVPDTVGSLEASRAVLGCCDIDFAREVQRWDGQPPLASPNRPNSVAVQAAGCFGRHPGPGQRQRS